MFFVLLPLNKFFTIYRRESKDSPTIIYQQIDSCSISKTYINTKIKTMLTYDKRLDVLIKG